LIYGGDGDKVDTLKEQKHMATREIHTWPSRVLKERAAPVEEFGEELQRLIDDMLETMYAAPGIGLAAPQVGVSRRIMVIDLSSGTEPEQVLILANPEIVETVGEVTSEEGCLSLPEFSLKIRRAESVVVRGYDREGLEVEVRGEDLLARALQHEIDHLDGVLLLDRVNPFRREIVKKKLKKALAPAE
jgi:peptide deformylase